MPVILMHALLHNCTAVRRYHTAAVGAGSWELGVRCEGEQPLVIDA